MLRIMEVSSSELKRAVEDQHGGRATLAQSVPIKAEFQGKIAREGLVHIFDLVGYPKPTVHTLGHHR